MSLTDSIKQRYSTIATTVSSSPNTGCSKPSTTPNLDPITRDLYSFDESSSLPLKAFQASLGCGNPTAMVDILPGMTVLDLGSGGGIDCLLSAKRVGDVGKVYGLDMTESMISLARKNVAEAGVTNIEFLHGNMESIPLPDSAVDIIISNCVINLAADKDIVLHEAYRVLKKGGKFAVSDIVLRHELPEKVRRDVAMWTGCVSGALVEGEYISKLKGAGFVEASVEEVRVYTESDIQELSNGADSCCGSPRNGKFNADEIKVMAGNVMSSFIRATK